MKLKNPFKKDEFKTLIHFISNGKQWKVDYDEDASVFELIDMMLTAIKELNAGIRNDVENRKN